MLSLVRLRRLTVLWVVPVASLLVLAIGSTGQEPPPGDRAVAEGSLRDDFEHGDVAWVSEGGDASHRVRLHDRTPDIAHTGAGSERIALTAGNGSHLHYGYPVSRALVCDDLKVSLWLKGDRPGVRLLARVVFPRERDPDTLQLLGTLVPGAVYDQAGNWQQLELTQPVVAVERQARLLRASLGRDVDTREAYVDRIVLNVFTGPGDSTVWIDDLEVSPTFESHSRTATAKLGEPGESTAPDVEISQDRLLVAGRPRLLRAMRAPGVPATRLKEFGFSVVSVEWPLDMELLQQAVTERMWLMPELPARSLDEAVSGPAISQLLGQFPFRESVLCWNIGVQIGPGASKSTIAAARQLRAQIPRRPVAGDVTGNFRSFSRELEMVGAHRLPIGTAMDIRRYRDWLSQRRYLARPGTYFFTWVQAAPAPSIDPEVADSLGPDADQVRLLTYAALAAGCRGFGFWADQSLGQSGMGRERLLELGLLNLELQLLEPYFASAGSVSTTPVETLPVPVTRGPGATVAPARNMFGNKRGLGGGFAPLPKQKVGPDVERQDIEATLVRSDYGLVVLPVWYGPGAQFVPGQLAANDLNIVVPAIPDAAQAWLVTPAELRSLKRERVAGGTRLTLPEFDLTAIVLVTSDAATLTQLRKEIAKTAPLAALWATELAGAEYERTRRVDAQLATLGHALPDSAALLQAAGEQLSVSRRALERSDFRTSYVAAHRSMRSLRLLRRAHWDGAVKPMSFAHASLYTTAFDTLPHHWDLVRAIDAGQFSSNLIAGGDFESAEALADGGWSQTVEIDEQLEVGATLSSDNPHGGSRSLHLQLKPDDAAELPASLDPQVAALVSKPILIKAGDVLRVRFWMRVPAPIEGSADGAVIFDSIGGRSLALSQVEPLEWKQFTFYRYATRSDELTITIGLTGVGDIYVDDLEVARLIGPAALNHPAGNPLR
jgi:hypothetical protein